MSSVKTFFNVYSKGFNEIYESKSFVNRIVNLTLRKSLFQRFEGALAFLSPAQGKSYFDLGCGPGQYVEAFLARGASEVTGIDFAPEMLQLAKKRLSPQFDSTRFHLIEGDFMGTPFPRNYDYLVSTGFMDYVEHPEAIIKKIIQITKKRIFVSFPKKTGFLAWQRKLRYRSKCYLRYYEADEIRNFLKPYPGLHYTMENTGREVLLKAEHVESSG